MSRRCQQADVQVRFFLSNSGVAGGLQRVRGERLLAVHRPLLRRVLVEAPQPRHVHRHNARPVQGDRRAEHCHGGRPQAEVLARRGQGGSRSASAGGGGWSRHFVVVRVHPLAVFKTVVEWRHRAVVDVGPGEY